MASKGQEILRLQVELAKLQAEKTKLEEESHKLKSEKDKMPEMIIHKVCIGKSSCRHSH